MKKILISILLFGMLQNINAQLKIKGFIETGYFREGISINNDGVLSDYDNENVLYSDIVFDLSIKNVHLEQQIFNVFDRGKPLFSVISILYKTRAYYKWKSFSLGYEHMCLHPIISQHNELPLSTIRASHNKIFLRFTFEN